MALSSVHPSPDSWARWPQAQHSGPEFVFPGTMVPYECRTTAPPPLRTELAHSMIPVTTYAQTPISTPASPQFPTAPYHSYSTYSPPPMMNPPFKTDECVDSVQSRLPSPPHHADEPTQDRTSGSLTPMGARSPSIKSEARSAGPSSPSPKVEAEELPPQGVPPVQFNTAIDNLVRVIEASPEIFGESKESKAENTEGDEKNGQTQGEKSRRAKRFCCDYPGCTRKFGQKNNLDTHRRAHTGEKPYVCPYCSRRFTQSVNLKSHINRHTGARPYKCPQCPKRFPQPSNVKAHMKTHVRRELRANWVCKFPGCHKAFTAKGNLKNHQNTYHVEAIEAFNAKLASMEDKSQLSQEEKEMAKYLAEVHNLANKGIKGRGKGRKVKRIMLHPPQSPCSPTPSATPLSAASPIGTPSYGGPVSLVGHGLPHHLQQHHNPAGLLPPTSAAATAAPQPHGLPYYGLSHPAAYSMSKPPPPPPASMLYARDPYPAHGGFGMLDSDTLSDASSVHGSTPAVIPGVYDDEHGRVLAFGERLY